MNLYNTNKLMENMRVNLCFDSYAVYVKCGEFENMFFSENVNEQTYFDIASCGKILVTTPLILQAIDEEKISLDTTLNQLFDEVPADKKNITIKHLLTHTSGIVRHSYIHSGREYLIKEILSQPLKYEIGTDYVYSCSGMNLLGFILEKIYGESLENLFEKRIKQPLGYERSKFNINTDEKNAAICYRSKNIKGLSSPWDDENVRIMQTSAGSGGQFFTLADIKKFTEAVLKKDKRLYSANWFDIAEQEHSPKCSKESHGLGWLYVDEKYMQTGDLFPKGSFGHCGHCGQSIFFNRQKNMCVVILTNATRFLNNRKDFKGYDYNVICEMRRCIHNEIFKDLSEQKLI